MPITNYVEMQKQKTKNRTKKIDNIYLIYVVSWM